MLTITHFTTDYEETPRCLDNPSPVFSWQLMSEEALCLQQAYELTIGEWTTGRIEGRESIGIAYGGPELKPESHYSIHLTVWDNLGRSASLDTFFDTGVKDWQGAQWIGGTEDDLIFDPYRLSVFRASHKLKIQEGSAKAGFYFSGDDPRLLDKDSNLYGVEYKKGESRIILETDLSGLEEGRSAMLHIYRTGFLKTDTVDQPLKSMEIPQLTLENAHDEHTYFLRVVCGSLDLYLDREEDGCRINQPDPNSPVPPMFRTASVGLNPVGMGGDYTCLISAGAFGAWIPEGQKAKVSDITFRNYREPGHVLYQEGVKTESKSEPLLRKEFTVEGEVRRASLYITARGIYEAALNGVRIGEDWLNPGSTQYEKHHLYQAYDLTSQLTPGTQALAVQLAEGWWSGFFSFEAKNWNYWGDRSSLLAKLVVEYADGTRQVLVTDDSWKLCTDSSLRHGSLFQGQITDLSSLNTLENASTADFDDSSWKRASVVPADETTSYQGTHTEYTFMGPKVTSMDFAKTQLVGQIGPCVKPSQVLTAKSVNEIRPGRFIYDLGQNIAGVPRIHIVHGQKGQVVKLRFAEVLYPDLPEYENQKGMLMVENLRAALVTDEFTLRDGEQILEPHFTFHGYRYLEVTGLKSALPLEAVQSVALTSVPELKASYETSNPEVNQLWSNISWSLQDNFLSIPTDCPQRNERQGWSGDLSVFSRSAVHMADSAGFLRRHMLALRDTQAPNGRFADIAPVGNGFGGVLWGSVGLTAAWESYLQYRDRTLLEQQYPAMKQYAAFLESSIDPATGLLKDGPLGDWLGPEYSKNEPAFLWAVYHAFDLYILSQTAQILEYPEEAAQYQTAFLHAKEEFNRIFVDPQTHRTVFSSEAAMQANRHAPMMAPTKLPIPPKSPCGKPLMDTQTSYAVPLALGIFSEEHIPYAAQYLEEAVCRENADNDGILRPAFSLMTGFIGTAWIMPALSMYGRNEAAYRLLQNGEYPSWIYSVRQGATTIWERLNSYTVENGFGGNNNMNSFNHYSFGAVAAWMCMYSLGIEREEQHPGYTHFTLRPVVDPTGQMTYARGHMDTVSGRIESSWEKTENGYRYQFRVPANATAHLVLPGREEELLPGVYEFE